jgi:AcrR family transcriptional regulator
VEPPKPPRSPRTEAGAEIIESVLAAAEIVIEQDGLAKFTTNRVAERAGVSVGSLYQYFPNKESVLAELARRLERRTQAQLIEILRSSSEVSLADTAARVVDAMLVGIGGLTFRRALLQEVPAAWFEQTSDRIDAELRDHLSGVLAARRDVRGGRHELMAWVIAHAIEGIVEAAVRSAPQLVGEAEFRAELIELVERYLTA